MCQIVDNIEPNQVDCSATGCIEAFNIESKFLPSIPIRIDMCCWSKTALHQGVQCTREVHFHRIHLCRSICLVPYASQYNFFKTGHKRPIESFIWIGCGDDLIIFKRNFCSENGCPNWEHKFSSIDRSAQSQSECSTL